ncbi:MAG: hypothetical protein K0U40_05525 [Betaproteobacteria bacterium]|nr:hypothetical protein [Betaproteobacteria bacterium]
MAGYFSIIPCNLLLSFMGGFIVRLLYRKSKPTERLKAKYQHYFGERS